MDVTFIGVDPGVTGAVAAINKTVSVYDLPVTVDTFTANQSKMLDISAFADAFEKHMPCADYIVLATERMQGMGFKTPARTLTMLAEMSGNIEAVVRLLCREYGVSLFIRKYQPKTWTHWMFPDSGDRQNRKTEAKNESLEKARDLFPELKDQLSLKKHHDRAEALLLAFTAMAELSGCVVDPKYKKTSDLVDVYLNHSQASHGNKARITDILGENVVLQARLLEEIEKRKNGN